MLFKILVYGGQQNLEFSVFRSLEKSYPIEQRILRMRDYLLNHEFEKKYSICPSDYEQDHKLTQDQSARYIHHLEKRLTMLEDAVKDLSVQVATKEDLALVGYNRIFGVV